MRVAHLILAHAHPEQLRRLIGRLQHPEASVFIHIDLKTDLTPFLSLAHLNQVFFIKKRVRVNWGGYTIVQATLNGMAEILESGTNFDFINLLSGQDYPIRSNAYIHNFLSANKGKAFMHTLLVTTEWTEAITRVTEYHLPDAHFSGKYRATQLLNKLLPARKMPLGMVAAGRSQWFTIPVSCATYLLQFLQDHPEVVRFFKLTWAPDELVFQTILYNSPHRQHMVNDNLRYIDWSAGGASPKLLDSSDADKLMRSGKLYARKFAPDSNILDYLDNHSE